MALEKGGVFFLTEVTKGIDEISECLRRGGNLVVSVQEFGEILLAVAARALRFHGEIHNEEIKRVYQVKTALHDLVLVAEKAFAFLDRVDDVVRYCGGSSMAAAREELRFSIDLQLTRGLCIVVKRGLLGWVKHDCGYTVLNYQPENVGKTRRRSSRLKRQHVVPTSSGWGAFWRGYYSLLNMLTRTPDLNLLHKLCDQLNRSMAQAERSYLEFVDACNTASESCRQAAEFCARKAKEARETEKAVRNVGSAASRLALGVGLLLSVATAGIGPTLVGAAVSAVGTLATAYLAQAYAESEASFRSIQGEFDCLMKFSFDLKEGMAHVHTNLEGVSTQVNHIAFCMKNGHANSVVFVHDALKRLNVHCNDSRVTTSRCTKHVKDKVEELKQKVQIH